GVCRLQRSHVPRRNTAFPREHVLLPRLPTAPGFRLARLPPSRGGLAGALRPTAWSIFCAVLLLLGCGRPMGGGTPTEELDWVDLAPPPGWPAAIAARSVPASFRTTITALDVDPRGKVWLLRDEISSPSQLDGVPVLERYASNGHLERRISFP